MLDLSLSGAWSERRLGRKACFIGSASVWSIVQGSNVALPLCCYIPVSREMVFRRVSPGIISDDGISYCGFLIFCKFAW